MVAKNCPFFKLMKSRFPSAVHFSQLWCSDPQLLQLCEGILFPVTRANKQTAIYRRKQRLIGCHYVTWLKNSPSLHYTLFKSVQICRPTYFLLRDFIIVWYAAKSWHLIYKRWYYYTVMSSGFNRRTNQLNDYILVPQHNTLSRFAMVWNGCHLQEWGDKTIRTEAIFILRRIIFSPNSIQSIIIRWS